MLYQFKLTDVEQRTNALSGHLITQQRTERIVSPRAARQKSDEISSTTISVVACAHATTPLSLSDGVDSNLSLYLKF